MRNVMLVFIFCLTVSFSMFAQPLDFSVDSISDVVSDKANDNLSNKSSDKGVVKSKVTFNVSDSFSTIKVDKANAKVIISYADDYSITVIPEDDIVPNKDFIIDATGDKITITGVRKTGLLGFGGHDVNIGTVYITTPNLHKIDSTMGEKRDVTQNSDDKFNVATSGKSILSTSNASWLSFHVATSGDSVIDLFNITVLGKSNVATSGNSRLKFTNATMINDFEADTSGNTLFDIVNATFFEDVQMSLSGGSVVTLSNVYTNEVVLHASGQSTVVVN